VGQRPSHNILYPLPLTRLLCPSHSYSENQTLTLAHSSDNVEKEKKLLLKSHAYFLSMVKWSWWLYSRVLLDDRNNMRHQRKYGDGKCRSKDMSNRKSKRKIPKILKSNHKIKYKNQTAKFELKIEIWTL